MRFVVIAIIRERESYNDYLSFDRRRNSQSMEEVTRYTHLHLLICRPHKISQHTIGTAVVCRTLCRELESRPILDEPWSSLQFLADRLVGLRSRLCYSVASVCRCLQLRNVLWLNAINGVSYRPIAKVTT